MTAMPDLSWPDVRALFPVTGERVYLDTASYGPPPRAAALAVERAVSEWQLGTADWRAWEGDAERCRTLFARLIAGRAEDVALLPVASQAAALVAESLPAGPGANLVVGEAEFRSNLFPWLLQERRGIEVRQVPFREGGPAVEDVAAAVDEETLLVAFSSVQSASGFRLDVPAVSAVAREHGARFFLDGTQSVGALSIDLEHVDYLVTAAYKWLLGPRGATFLWIRPERQSEVAPLWAGWRAPADPYARYYGGPLELADDASRFDASLAWIPWVGLAPALELLVEVGLERIEARDLELASAFRAGAAALGLEVPQQESSLSQIVSLPVGAPDQVAAGLRERGIAAAVRDRYLRVAFHLFNDEADVEAALAVLGGASG